MDEQTGSPGANTDNNSQRNGDEVRGESTDMKWQVLKKLSSSNSKQSLPVEVKVELLREPSNRACFCYFVETQTWQLDQGEEEEEANEGQQRTQGSPNGLRALHERQTGAATGRASRRALSRDYKDAGQRVEQAAPWGEAGQQWGSTRWAYNSEEKCVKTCLLMWLWFKIIS